MTLILKRVQLLKDKPRREAIDRFLRQHQLSLEADCEMAIIAEYQQRLVGCGAIAGNVLKCIAIDPSLQGEGLSLKLLTELLTLAYELGRSELFCSLNLAMPRYFPAPLLADSPGGRPRRANGK